MNPKLKDTTFFTLTYELFGHKMAVVMTHNEKLLEGQKHGIENILHKCMDELYTLQRNPVLWRSGIRKRGKRPTHDSVLKRVNNICSPAMAQASAFRKYHSIFIEQYQNNS